MTIEILLWVAGALVPVVLAWGVFVSHKLLRTDAQLGRLIYMHENADKFGFGTGGMQEALQNNSHAMQELTHYIKWLAQRDRKDSPPPYVRGSGDNE